MQKNACKVAGRQGASQLKLDAVALQQILGQSLQYIGNKGERKSHTTTTQQMTQREPQDGCGSSEENHGARS